jgi:hypothetical protein
MAELAARPNPAEAFATTRSRDVALMTSLDGRLRRRCTCPCPAFPCAAALDLDQPSQHKCLA